MFELRYEMTFNERIEGPLGPTTGSPERLCWKIAEATLAGPRIEATLAMPGIDWIRLGSDGTRRQDQRAQFLTVDGALIVLRYDTALIRGDRVFLAALDGGDETAFAARYMCMAPSSRSAAATTTGSPKACSSPADVSPGPSRSSTRSTESSEHRSHPPRPARSAVENEG
jgi:hypothetical protein